MRTYHLKRTQFLPIGLQEAWTFFATPNNLGVITPVKMNFKILSDSGNGKMIEGQIIKYKVTVFPLVRVSWITEIKEVREPYFFIDTQLSGPYSLWHHKHSFKEVPGGVEMTDEVTYAIPFGVVGRLANAVFVNREVNRIFDYRFNVLTKLFKEKPKTE